MESVRPREDVISLANDIFLSIVISAIIRGQHRGSSGCDTLLLSLGRNEQWFDLDIWRRRRKKVNFILVLFRDNASLKIRYESAVIIPHLSSCNLLLTANVPSVLRFDKRKKKMSRVKNCVVENIKSNNNNKNVSFLWG